jgi:DNA transposition AAA+ family ATPase
MGKRVRRLRREGTFYSTQLSRRVAETLEYCHEQQAIGIVTADFGCGKTAAVRHWREQNAGRVSCTVMECDEFCSTNKLDFVRSLAKLYGITRKVGTMNGGLVFEELCEQVRENPGLIVIDQTETLAARCCQIIRQLWDKTSDAGVGVVMLAAPILLERLMAGRTADLGALQSRVGIWVPLSGLTRSEMAAIVRQEGIVDVDEAAFDVWNKAIGGSIRRLMRSIDLLKSRHAGKRVSETTVAGVAGHLWGLNLSKAA